MIIEVIVEKQNILLLNIFKFNNGLEIVICRLTKMPMMIKLIKSEQRTIGLEKHKALSQNLM